MIDSLPLELIEEILLKLDPISLAMLQCADKSINSHISNDPYFKSNVEGSIPKRCGSSGDGYEFRQPSSSAMEVDEKVAHDDKCIFSLSLIMRGIGKISLGKRLLVEDETTLKRKVSSSSSSYDKFMNVERINKIRRVT
ncbi:hypothetical protein Bca52824_012851 [Brassica carinata]|uniref:F-box domain-containing protein n=1 Tax=Brassica carinata TaxID=52824 RepID=A0A8X7VWV8_BRACI|nr:hypothetical protein Bca52824_012851 [Brassica carinata]